MARYGDHNFANKADSRENAKSRKVFRPGKKLPAFIAGFFLVLLLISFFAHFQKLYVLQGEIKDIKIQLQELTEKNEELKAQLRQAQSDAYIEQVAREKLGLVKPGESRIITAQ